MKILFDTVGLMTNKFIQMMFGVWKWKKKSCGNEIQSFSLMMANKTTFFFWLSRNKLFLQYNFTRENAFPYFPFQYFLFFFVTEQNLTTFVAWSQTNKIISTFAIEITTTFIRLA